MHRWPIESALRLNPNFPLALGVYGLVLCWCDRWKEGNEAARRALLMSPRDPFSAVYNGIAAYAEFVERNYDKSMRLARDEIRQRFDFVGAHRMLTAAAGMAGKIDLAKAALEDLRRTHPGVSLAWIGKPICHSGCLGSVSSSWKVSAARAWNSRRSLVPSIATATRNRLDGKRLCSIFSLWFRCIQMPWIIIETISLLPEGSG